MEEDNITDEFKIDFDDSLDDEYEKVLDKDIEANCGINVYVDKLEIQEINEATLLTMDKKEIIDHKNYQIQKLKAYIVSLEKEKDDLIENFKNTTNILLEKIKQKEYDDYGVRPQTAKIVENIKQTDKNSYNLINKVRDPSYYAKDNLNNTEIKKKIDIISFEDSNNADSLYERCANCKKDILKEKTIMHSLDCLRNNMTCKICKELIPVKDRKEHLNEWRTTERIMDAIKNNDHIKFMRCIDHGSNPNQILDSEKGNAIIHMISKHGNLKFLEIILGKDVDLDAVNLNKESSLFIAIIQKNVQMVKALIEVGIDITKRNSEDLTPLMLACKLGLIPIVELLLLNQANLSETNVLGETALKLAQRFGHEDLVLILIQKYKALIRQPSRK